MKSRPILFSAPMILALLDGSKTQTRRIVKFKDRVNRWSELIDVENHDGNWCFWSTFSHDDLVAEESIQCPYGAIGDQLWVKETYRSQYANDSQKPIDITEGDPIRYEADEHENGNPLYGWGRIRQSIFMRHWMSRITLEITNVRIERLQDISEEDAKAEGVQEPLCKDGLLFHRKCDHPSCPPPTWRNGYQVLWESINGPDSWKANPYVWALTFNIIKP